MQILCISQIFNKKIVRTGAEELKEDLLSGCGHNTSMNSVTINLILFKCNIVNYYLNKVFIALYC
jgi:hypothetical protein